MATRELACRQPSSHWVASMHAPANICMARIGCRMQAVALMHGTSAPIITLPINLSRLEIWSKRSCFQLEFAINFSRQTGAGKHAVNEQLTEPQLHACRPCTDSHAVCLKAHQASQSPGAWQSCTCMPYSPHGRHAAGVSARGGTHKQGQPPC